MGARQVDEETIRRWIAEGIAANPGGGTSYLVYTALFSQAGTSAPTYNVLENTIGTITSARGVAGSYSLNSSGLFTLDKTVTPPFGFYGGNTNTMLPLIDPYGDGILGWIQVTYQDANIITINVFDEAFVLTDWSAIAGASTQFIEIRVYP